MPSITRVLTEAVVLGLAMIPATYAASWTLRSLPFKLRPSLPEICSKWNRFYVMEITVFLAGFLFHVVAQLLGINAWYVRNYRI